MSRKDEYNEIYLQNGNFWLSYTYKNHTLGKEQIIYPHEIVKIGTSKCNENKIFIKCGKCNVYMNYIHSLRSSFSGKWMCSHCGSYVRETTVNTYIDRLPDLMKDNEYDDIY
ncbi:MAG: hypothetical protein Q4G33_14375 [bacterium]|nr:hypothetical protein [bacterium]